MWRQVLQQQLTIPFRDFVTDYEFSSPIISIKAFATSDYSDNYRIGRVRAIYIGQEINGSKTAFRTIRLQQQFIRFLDLPYKYKLEFIWYVWLPSLTLTFYEPQYGDIIDLALIQGTLMEDRANIAYISNQLTRVESKIDNLVISNVAPGSVTSNFNNSNGSNGLGII